MLSHGGQMFTAAAGTGQFSDRSQLEKGLTRIWPCSVDDRKFELAALPFKTPVRWPRMLPHFLVRNGTVSLPWLIWRYSLVKAIMN